jgi:RNA polymerase sigma factor (sigma-70 family)
LEQRRDDDRSPHQAIRPGEEATTDLRDRLTQGDAQAFDELVSEFYPKVSLFVQRLTGWNMDADEIVQEVFLAAWCHAKKYRGDASPLTWLRSIAMNECRRRYRRLGLWRRWKTDVGFKLTERTSDASDAPLHTKERAETVRLAIQQLPYLEREVVVLHYLEQQNIEQIAALLGIRRNVVDVRLHRARRRLKPNLQGLVEDWES